MKILFLLPYPLQEAPSQRFRLEQYFAMLENAGHHIQSQSFLSSKDWKLFFKPGRSVKKFLTLIRGYFKRIYSVLITTQFDFVFIHREATPLGPPIVEWIISNILHKKIIYDFDDAIWLTDRKNESSFLRLLKWRGKVKLICQWSYKVSCGNHYLQEYALQFNNKAILNPTTIDGVNLHKPPDVKTNTEKVVIGWTGSHSTIKYLHSLETVLQTLESEFNFVSFLAIADQPPSMNLQRLEFIPWKSDSEIDDLLKLDIGIMPLPDDEWTKGKCGFKALQYMALEIPAVVSNVGVNSEIVTQGVEGFICSSNDEWLTAIRKLIINSELRIEQGKNGRKKVIENYSVISNSANFLSLFS